MKSSIILGILGVLSIENTGSLVLQLLVALVTMTTNIIIYKVKLNQLKNNK